MPGTCAKAFRCSSELDSTPAVRLMPFTYAMSDHKMVRDKLTSYGHAWSTIDIFYLCVVMPLLQQNLSHPVHVIIPERFMPERRTDGRSVSAYEELQTIFSGPAAHLRIHRARWVPICYDQYGIGCCAGNASTVAPPTAVIAKTIMQGGDNDIAALLRGVNSPQLAASGSRLSTVQLDNLTDLGSGVGLAQLTVDEVHNRHHLGGRIDGARLRRIAWTNVGVDGNRVSEHLVLWASSENATNGRMIVHESTAVAHVRKYMADTWPQRRFVHKRLVEMSFRQELRLLARTSVFITLFGSAEHHCRWLPPGAIVLEIRGAMKNDFPDYKLYPDLCARVMGLRWAGMTTPGHAPQIIRTPTGITTFGDHVRDENYWRAKLDQDELVATLDQV